MRNGLAITACAIGVAILLAGCVWPGQADSAILNRYQKAMTDRSPQQRLGEQGLDSLKPTPGTTGPELKVTHDPATGRSQVRLPLEEVIVRALANSVDIRVASFNPPIARQELIKEDAAFDYIVFGGYQYQSQNQQVPNPLLELEQFHSWTYEMGIKQKTITGAEWSLAYNLNRTRQPADIYPQMSEYFATATLGVTQPLLRDAWPEVNLAKVNLAKVNEKTSNEVFRQKVEEIVTQVIGTYWALVQARISLAIEQNLLDITVATLNRVKARAELDATAVEIKQAEAAVESRRAQLILAQKTILDVQDALSRLMADDQINLISNVEMIPTTDPVTVEIKIDVVDRLITALKYNPNLTQVRLAVEAADINVMVAFNQTLPRLDLTASTTFQGFDSTGHQANKNLSSADHGSYTVGLEAEYPLGNRAAEAELRHQKLARLQTLTNLQNAADLVTQDVRDTARQVQTSYQEMLAQRASVAAAAMQLRALEDTEKIRGRLTPEFLQVKLQAQESLSQAQHAELQALINYNIALADLNRVTGTTLQVQNVRIALPAAIDMAPSPLVPTSSSAPSSAPVTILDTYRQVWTRSGLASQPGNE
ncbi:MAG: TolC family protein [Phycisphaerae bacterium]|jgi:outer membrane protein TolC